MKKYILPIAVLFVFGATISAQTDKPIINQNTQQSASKDALSVAKTIAIKPDATPLELAKVALQAHGGDKFKNMKSLTQAGSIDVAMPNSTQTMTASFRLIMAGEKFRFELNSPFANFQQIYDGENLYASMGGSDVPPLSKLGLNLLNKAENQGYKISALPDKKKRRGFRIAAPEGYATDFYLDPVTGRVMSYEAKLTVRDREVSTAVEHDKFREIEGIIVPEKFSQRFDIGGNTFYANFKAKEVLVNTNLADDVFALPQ